MPSTAAVIDRPGAARRSPAARAAAKARAAEEEALGRLADQKLLELKINGEALDRDIRALAERLR